MTDSLVQQGQADDAEEALRPLSTAPRPVGPSTGERGAAAARRVWRQLTSMRTALQLLFLLALAALPGSVIPQHGQEDARVREFFTQHPTLAPILDRLSLFDVFAAPWFAAVYLLLFVSLIGCLVPRLRLHARALRQPPPAAPRRFTRLPESTSWEAPVPPSAAVDAAASVLRSRRWRIRRDAGAPGASGGATAPAVSAEKGYLRETGNLLFHGSLVVLLAAIAMGGLWGYKGDVLVIEGRGFSNTPLAYDSLHPGRLFSPDRMAPFTFRLTDFRASYLANGQAASFDANVRWRPRPGAPTRGYDVRENHPLVVGGDPLTGGVKLYLGGHGYAPHFVVRKPDGTVVFDDDVAFLPENGTTYQSTGVVKVAEDFPEQLAFQGFFTPTTVRTSRGLESAYPGPRNPAVTLTAYHGRLVDTGSVYSVDTRRMTQYRVGGRPAARSLAPGQTWRLPDGTTLTFSGFREFANFHVTYDPGKRLALVSAGLMVLGLLLSLRVRRRRLWVRARPAAGGGRSVVEVGGLARSDTEQFHEEFGRLVGALRERVPAEDGRPAPEPAPQQAKE